MAAARRLNEIALREPLCHAGQSGTSLERIVLADGRRLVAGSASARVQLHERFEVSRLERRGQYAIDNHRHEAHMVSPSTAVQTEGVHGKSP